MMRCFRMGLLAILPLGMYALTAPAADTSPARPVAPRAPFKVLYSNDTTNILSCVSPYHQKRQPPTDEMICATIDEAAAADAHLLQPGLGAIPFWQSKVYPLDEHYRYYEQKYHNQPSGFAWYLLTGGDVVKTFVEHCRHKHVAPFISLRMNDGHGLEFVGTGDRYAADAVSRFYEEHYLQWRIGPDPKSWDQRVLNWAIPEVRAYKFALLRELCENYDLDGLELDFMRHASYFQLDKTTSAQRREIITGFVRQVRELLDRTARGGQHRWLCVRVPAFLDTHDALGIDLPALVGQGVDMVNLSISYFTVQQTDLPKIRRMIPRAAVYLEMTHTAFNGPSHGPYDTFTFNRTTPQQFYTTAHLAYRQGADGVSLFNFVYYREHGSAGRGPFNEPPFDVLPHLGDRDWLAQQPQWYHLAGMWALPYSPRPLPKRFAPGHGEQFTIELAPNEHRVHDGVLRLMTREPVADDVWEVTVNGVALQPIGVVAKPLDHPYEGTAAGPDQYACFACPRAAVKAGANTIGVRLKSGVKNTLAYFDLVLP